jgi:hypothetical protein
VIGLSILLLAATAPDAGDQKTLDRISISCGLSARDITIRQGKLVRIRPERTPSYKAVLCVLPKLNKAGFSAPIGFISEPSVERDR